MRCLLPASLLARQIFPPTPCVCCAVLLPAFVACSNCFSQRLSSLSSTLADTTSCLTMYLQKTLSGARWNVTLALFYCCKNDLNSNSNYFGPKTCAKLQRGEIVYVRTAPPKWDNQNRVSSIQYTGLQRGRLPFRW